MTPLRHSFRRLRALLGLALVGALASGCVASVTFSPVGERPLTVALLDATNDGRADVAVLDGAAHTVALLAQEEGGGLAAAVTLKPAPFSAPADVAGVTDATGAPALAVAEPGGDRIGLFARFEDGAAETSAIPLGAGAAPKALATADVNGDGFGDLLV